MLLCVGLATLDLVQVVPAVPRPNEKVVALDAGLDIGGPAANAAVTARLLGVRTRLVTAVGDDPLGRLARDLLRPFDVDLIDALHEPASWALPTSSVMITETTGERAVVSRNAAATPDTRWDDSWLDGVTAVLLDGHHSRAALAAARAARAGGIPVVLDGGSWKPITPELMPSVDFAILSADFRPPGLPATAAAPAILDAVRSMGAPAVARTRGGEPILVMDDAGARSIPVRRATLIRDTLGAGDVLHGAFAAQLALAAGKAARWSLDGALAVAADLATLSCEHQGARGWARAVDPSDALRLATAGRYFAELADFLRAEP